MNRGELERGLAEFATGTEWEKIPQVARERATDLLLDGIACAITGRHAHGRDGVESAMRSSMGPGSALVIDDAPAAPYAATFLNAWQTTATTMCDVYRPRMCHVTPIVLPAVLAAAHSDTPMHELCAAFAIGIETTVRICDAMRADRYQGARWHAPGVIGPFGSATAAGRLQGLDAEGLTKAWSAALLHSSGTFAAIGSPGVKLTQARGSAAGVLAVEMTAAGLGGGPDAFTHPDGGLFDAYDGDRKESLLDGLGEQWRLLEVSLRRWPASSSLQTTIEAVLETSDGRPDVDLELALPPQSYKLCAGMGWDEQLPALQSARWVTAVTWIDRECWLGQFDTNRRADAATARLAERVRVVEDRELPQGAARLVVDGEVASELHTVAGSPERPLSREDVLEKLARAAGDVRARRVADCILGGDTTGLLALLGARAG